MGDLELEETVPEALKLAHKKGYLVIVVTNQPVIARNLCTIEELNQIHAKLGTELGRHGAYVDAIYYCPHHLAVDIRKREKSTKSGVTARNQQRD